MCHLPQEKPIECLIHNQKYLYEYLYASDDFSSAHIVKNTYHNVFTISVGAVDDFGRLKWTIAPSFKSNATLTIKSSQNEYLCSSESYQDMFRNRRKLFLKKRNNAIKMIGPHCHWRFEQIGNKSLYVIWNDWHNEPLYSPSFIYKHDSSKRNVFLWKNKPSSSGQFRWLVDCRKGDFLLE